MANICSFKLMVKGRKENVDTFTNILVTDNPDKTEERFFCGIYEASVGIRFIEGIGYVNYEGYQDPDDENTYYRVLFGDCKWSIRTSMTKSGYFSESVKNAVCLETITEELGLKVEAYSEECGFSFQEHYIFDKGACVLEEEEEYSTLCLEELGDEPTDEEILDFIECNEDVFDEYDIVATPAYVRELIKNSNEGYYSFGGMKWDFTI